MASATYIAVHSEKPGEITAEVHAYKSMPGDYLNIKTDSGTVTFHDVDMVTLKNEILWAFQEWERRRNKS